MDISENPNENLLKITEQYPKLLLKQKDKKGTMVQDNGSIIS